MQDETVLNKMIKELQAAKANEQNRQVFLQHINHVKLLCELFLDEEEPRSESSDSSISEQEIKAMLGDKKSSLIEKKASSTINHDGANGDSIFDF